VSRLDELKIELADDAAQTHLECLCKWEMRNGNRWYDTKAEDLPFAQEWIDKSVEYLKLRRKLERNQLHPNLVMVKP